MRMGVLVHNNRQSAAREWAAVLGIETHHVSARTVGSEQAVDREVCLLLESADTDLVLLSGYMKKLGPLVLGRFDGRILNLHPGPLPEFGGQGMHGDCVHRAVVDAGVTSSAATIHLVDGAYDHGPVVGVAPVAVRPTDTAGSLAARVRARELELVEHILGGIARERVSLDDYARGTGQVITLPLSADD